MTSIDGVRFSPLVADQRIPLLAEPEQDGLDAAGWARANRGALEEALHKNGAVLFRGFGFQDQDAFSEFSNGVTKPLDYVYRSTPRQAVGKQVYTSTEYPQEATIPMHCENAYKREWPMKLLFYCAIAAEKGGETPLADVVEVTRRISPEIQKTFVDKGVMYVRNYGGGVDLPWQTVFQTEKKDEVEQYCREHDLDFEWYGGDQLRTRQVCQAMATHPSTGDEVWFNQAHLFHVSSLDEGTREAMLSLFKEEELPRNSYFGDGSAIDVDMLDEIRTAFATNLIAFPWQQGDVLAVDNMLVAHGRYPFSGKRKVLVTMGDPFAGPMAA